MLKFPSTPKWASLAPDFEEVDEQVQYIEQEDEFDQDNDYLKKDQNKFETDISAGPYDTR